MLITATWQLYFLVQDDTISNPAGKDRNACGPAKVRGSGGLYEGCGVTGLLGLAGHEGACRGVLLVSNV